MTTFLLTACATIAVLSIAHALVVCAGMRWSPELTPHAGADAAGRSREPDAQLPRLTVVVPARNEESGLAEALASILAQPGVDLKVVVVNDSSTDRTGAIADAAARDDPRLEVMHDPPLEPGWLGKPNALRHGAARAHGDYLLFTDADIVHLPGGFAAAIAEMERGDYGLLSLIPDSHWHTFWENMVAVAFYLGIPAAGIVHRETPRRGMAMAAGAFMLVRRSVYEAIGGHEPLRAAVVDDILLARLINRRGFRTGLRMAPRCLRCRMYRGNREAFWGLSKNILDAAEGRPWVAPLVLLPGAAAALLTAPAAIVAGLAMASATVVTAGLALYAIQYAGFFGARRLLRFKPSRMLGFPAAFVMLAACVARGLYYRLTKQSVVWRGREVRLDPAARDRRME